MDLKMYKLQGRASLPAIDMGEASPSGGQGRPPHC